jgi:RNA polymerase sigma-70 factor (ECF subfamily)
MPPSKVRTGHSDELETWIGDHRRKLVRTAKAILKDEEWAEDVVQETLLKFWVLEAREDVRRIGAYLVRAVRWNALKHRARRVAHVSLDQAQEPSVEPDPSDRADHTLGPLELERAIATLPPAQQAVIRLRFYAGLTFREVGRVLSISTNTAASRSRYALKRLRERLRRSPRGSA